MIESKTTEHAYLDGCDDCKMRRLFMNAFRGGTKGSMHPDIRKRIDRALTELKMAGYVKTN